MQKDDRLRIGISGTRTWENRTAIKTFISKLKHHTNQSVVVVGLGDKCGVDPLVKKYALEFGYQYLEANLAHTPHNLYSLMSEHFYDKPFHAKNIYLRNKVFANFVDSCVLFDDQSGHNRNLVNLIGQLNKQGKRVITIT